MPDKAVHVEGLDALVRAWRVANKEMAKDVRTAIEEAGEPIRQLGSELILREISGMSRGRLPWWRLRTGIEGGGTIGHVVPERRGVKSRDPANRRRRPRLAPLIAEREQRALDANRDKVEGEFVDALNRVARVWARV